MLRLEWVPAMTGAPDSRSYQRASDVLWCQDDRGAVSPAQAFGRGPFQGPPSLSLDLAQRLDHWLAGKNRVVVMVHGFLYDPTSADNSSNNPFHALFAPPGGTVAPQQSWLPLVGECDDLGRSGADRAIAFGWLSRPDGIAAANAGWSTPYPFAALDLAPLAARALATVLAHLCCRGVTVDILAHSLGTRVVSQAIGLLPSEAIGQRLGRMVLLGGAEFSVDALAHLAGKAEAVFNLASHTDVVLSLGAEQFCHPVRYNGSAAARVIGRAGIGPLKDWLDLQIDRDDVGAWFAAHGFTVSGTADNAAHPLGRAGHWVYYTNDGNRALVRALLSRPEMTIAWFRHNAVPEGITAAYYNTLHGVAIPPTPLTQSERAFLGIPPAPSD